MAVTTMAEGVLRIRGRFDGKHVELLEPPPSDEPCEVTVGFGLPSPDALTDEERRAIAVRTSGAWQDSRTTDEIIAEIMGSRTVSQRDVAL